MTGEAEQSREGISHQGSFLSLAGATWSLLPLPALYFLVFPPLLLPSSLHTLPFPSLSISLLLPLSFLPFLLLNTVILLFLQA